MWAWSAGAVWRVNADYRTGTMEPLNADTFGTSKKCPYFCGELIHDPIALGLEVFAFQGVHI